MYSPNYLGWISIFLVITTFITFLWLLVLDIKNKDFKNLLKRVLIFVLTILFCAVFSFYDAKKNEKLTREELKEILGN